MSELDETIRIVGSWSPELAETLVSLSFLGGETRSGAVGWSETLGALVAADGAVAAMTYWRRVLKENYALNPLVGLLIIEHMRKHPSQCNDALIAMKLGFARTIANVAFRVADCLYEESKSRFSGAEADLAIAQCGVALAEFRFAIESGLLSEPTRRIATGKYAAGVAMMGRWVDLPPATVDRAVDYSQESILLGNITSATIDYRLELLLQQFDQTGREGVLREARRLTSKFKEFAEGSELAQAETCLRLALLAHPTDAETYFALADRYCAGFVARKPADEARQIVFSHLLMAARANRGVLTLRSVAVPRGLRAAIAALRVSAGCDGCE
jgi:hypothetical protein